VIIVQTLYLTIRRNLFVADDDRAYGYTFGSKIAVNPAIVLQNVN